MRYAPQVRKTVGIFILAGGLITGTAASLSYLNEKLGHCELPAKSPPPSHTPQPS